MRRLVLVAALAGALSPPTSAQDHLTYVGRLELPVAGDSLGSSDAVTADPATGEIFVCDARNGRIVIYDGDGAFRHQIAGGDVFSAPRDLAVAPDGRLLLVANHRGRPALLELDFDGLLQSEIVLSGFPEEVDPPHLTSVALSPDGETVYAADQGNLRVWLASRSGEVRGSLDLAAGADDRTRRDRLLGHVDVYGDRLLVAVPSTGLIHLYSLDGRERGSVGFKGSSACQTAFPVAAARDERGELVLVDQQRMLLMRWTEVDNRCLAQYGGIGLAAGAFYFPHDLALDGAGRLYVSQGYEGRVQMYEGFPPAAGAAPPPAPRRKSSALGPPSRQFHWLREQAGIL
jgi:hypothetical protein